MQRYKMPQNTTHHILSFWANFTEAGLVLLSKKPLMPNN